MKYILLLLILAGCNPTITTVPYFDRTLEHYAADNGSNVFFTVNTYNSPDSVTCFNGTVIMSKVSANVWGGTANYSTNLVNHPGKTEVTCTAIKDNATVSTNVGFIELIPNVAPTIIMLATQTLCGNNGTKVFNAPLVDVTLSTYMTGAEYSLTAGQLTLPAGMSIDPINGNLIGTPASGNYTINNLKMTAITAVDQRESAKFKIIIVTTNC